MKKMTSLFALLLAFIAPTAMANTIGTNSVLQDSSGQTVTNNYGECWQTQGNTMNGCETPYVKPYTPPVVEQAIEPKYIEETQTISLSAKTLFGFGNDKLTSHHDLNEIVFKIKSLPVKTHALKSIQVEGHTDFMGTEQFNQTLSQKRADNVANYLANIFGSNVKVTAVGLGESQAKMTAQCDKPNPAIAKIKNKKAKSAALAKQRKELIACLEPDRRVDIRINTIKTTVKQVQ